MGNQTLFNFQLNQINLRKKGVRTPLVLMILDGWGLAPGWGGNAITLAETVNFDYLWKNFPKVALYAAEEKVGLPKGAPGNSEAGHLNIGAGRVVRQDIIMIDEQIAQNKLKSSTPLTLALEQTKKFGSSIHIMGLLSETGTHSHIRHLIPILNYLKQNQVKKVYLHLFSDGRDSDPMSGIVLLDKVEQIIKLIGLGTVSTIIGRYYAMDRDNHWNRTTRAYDLLTKCKGEKAESAGAVFSQSYTNGITDEFIEPRVIVNRNQSCKPIEDNDVIISFNFRSDRIKQLITSFLQPDRLQTPEIKQLKNLKILSFTIYQAQEDPAEHIFLPKQINYTLAQFLSSNNLSQLHCAETEKFPHVTYFINGGRQPPFSFEDRVLIPSPRVKTYDLAPKMSAQPVADTVISSIDQAAHDLVVVNFANPDMVGHSGNLQATMLAVSFVDQCLGRVLRKIFDKNATLIVCADHGNAEQMVNIHSGEPDTEHTTNPVPFIIANKSLHNKIALQAGGSLANIAPTILDLMALPIPPGVTYSQSLIIRDKSK